MATATRSNPMADYVHKLASLSPEKALELAMLETERQQAIAAQKAEEYRSMSEIEFDDKGRICKATMGGLWRLAQMYAGSLIVPKQYQQKPHDCFIACQMAFRLKVDPFAYMQSSYVVHGKPGIEAKLAIAMLNTSGKIKGRVKYREEKDAKTGKTIKCQAVAVDADTGEDVESTVDWAMVEAEGWNKKEGSKWVTIPDQMFRYRSATFLIRAFYPEVLMGMELADELEDIATDQAANGRSKPVNSLDELTDRLTLPQTNGLDAETTVETAAETSESDAGQGPHSEDVSQVNPLDGFAERLADCHDLAAVTVCENEFTAACETDEQRGEVAGRCQERRDAIKAARAKGKQGQLAGT